MKVFKHVQILKKKLVRKKENEPFIKKSDKKIMGPSVEGKKPVYVSASNDSSLSVIKDGVQQTNQINNDGEYFIKFYQKSRTNVWIKKDLSNKTTDEKEEGLVGEEGNVLYQKVTQ